MAIKICINAEHYGKYNRLSVVKDYYEKELSFVSEKR